MQHFWNIWSLIYPISAFNILEQLAYWITKEDHFLFVKNAVISYRAFDLKMTLHSMYRILPKLERRWSNLVFKTYEVKGSDDWHRKWAFLLTVEVPTPVEITLRPWNQLTINWPVRIRNYLTWQCDNGLRLLYSAYNAEWSIACNYRALVNNGLFFECLTDKCPLTHAEKIPINSHHGKGNGAGKSIQPSQ